MEKKVAVKLNNENIKPKTVNTNQNNPTAGQSSEVAQVPAIKLGDIVFKSHELLWEQSAHHAGLPNLKYMGTVTSSTWELIKNYHLARSAGLNNEEALNKASLSAVANIGVDIGVGHLATAAMGASGAIWLEGIMGASELAHSLEHYHQQRFNEVISKHNLPSTLSGKFVKSMSQNHRGESYGAAAALAAPSKMYQFLKNLGYQYLSDGKNELQNLSRHIGSWIHNLAQNTSEYASKTYTNIQDAWLDVSSKLFSKDMILGQQTNALSTENSLLYYSLVRSEFVKYFEIDNKQKLLCAVLNKNKLSQKFKSSAANSNQAANTQQITDDLTIINQAFAQVIKAAEEQGNGQFHIQLNEMNHEIETVLASYITQANARVKNQSMTDKQQAVFEQQRILRNVDDFCEKMNTCAQGAALVANLCGRKQFAGQIVAGTMAATQIVSGISSLAVTGLSSGGVGLVLGGINSLIGCFGSKKDKLGAAIMQQLSIISQQISGLHQDMLMHFSQVYKALGIIHQDMLKEFCALHRNINVIQQHLMQLHEMMETERSTVNAIGAKIDALSQQSAQYWKNGQTLKWTELCAEVKQKIEWGVNFKDYKKLHSKLISTIGSLQTNSISDAEKHSLTDLFISQSINGELGNLEADINLLIKYGHGRLGQSNLTYQVDSVAWESCTQRLMELFQIFAKTSQCRGMPRKIFDDFQRLQKVGQNWFAFVDSLQNSNLLTKLVNNYELSLQNAIQQINQHCDSIEVKNQQNTNKKIEQKAIEEKNKFSSEELKFKTDTYQWFIGWMYKETRKHSMNCQYDNNSTSNLRVNYLQQQGQQFKKHQNDYIKKIEADQLSVAHRIKNFTPNIINQSFWSKQRAKFIYPASNSNMTILLPLPNGDIFTIPQVFLLAEALGLGCIYYHYYNENSKFTISLSFVANDNTSYVVEQKELPFVLPNYFNPNEAIWNFWMGGEYATQGKPKNTLGEFVGFKDGYQQHSNYVPVCAHQVGCHNNFATKAISKLAAAASNAALIQVQQLVDKRFYELRMDANNSVLRNVEDANTATNPLSAAIIKLDANAKILKAFISVMFKKSCMNDPVLKSNLAMLFDKAAVISYLNNYQGQSFYLQDALQMSMEASKELKTYLEQKIITKSAASNVFAQLLQAKDEISRSLVQQEYPTFALTLKNLTRLIQTNEPLVLASEKAEACKPGVEKLEESIQKIKTLLEQNYVALSAITSILLRAQELAASNIFNAEKINSLFTKRDTLTARFEKLNTLRSELQVELTALKAENELNAFLVMQTPSVSTVTSVFPMTPSTATDVVYATVPTAVPSAVPTSVSSMAPASIPAKANSTQSLGEPFIPTEPTNSIQADNLAVQAFLGDFSQSNPSHLNFNTWYHPDVCHYLLQLVPNQAKCIRVNFFDAGYGNNTQTFKHQLQQLVMLGNALQRPAIFISKEPGADNHFICGLVKENRLLLINPLGISTKSDCYQTIFELKNEGAIGEVWFSSNQLQKHKYEEILVSCGAVTLELATHILCQFTPETLENFWDQLKTNQPTTHQRSGLIYHGVDITDLLPDTLKTLQKAHDEITYKEQACSIRIRHFKQLKSLPVQRAKVEGVDPEDYLKQCKASAPIQVLFNVLVTEVKTITNLSDLPEYKLFEREINKKVTNEHFQKVLLASVPSTNQIKLMVTSNVQAVTEKGPTNTALPKLGR